MSGSVAEALLATGSKKIPLLPPPPKVKKEPKTFTFELKLAESTDQSYPEFSWTELVKNAKQKELTKKAEKGNPVLDPFASDDEDDLKAMAAKFEAKYNTVSANPVKKKKRRAEDYIDKGAGYDETDPFIDNSDVYDEVVPPDLQTQHGGFYINSGSLDFKEVELSEDEEDSLSQAPKAAKSDKPKDKAPPALKSSSTVQKVKNPVGRPPGLLTKRPLLNDKTKMAKKRKLIVTPVGPGGKTIVKSTNNHAPPQLKINKPSQELIQKPTENSKPFKSIKIPSSSSSSSGSSSSGDSSSSSGSESSSAEDAGDKEKSKQKESQIAGPPKLKPSANPSLAAANPKQISKAARITNLGMPSGTHNSPPVKRLKTKNVNLNPKLHPNLAAASMSSTSPNNSTNNSPQQQQQIKILNKDLAKVSSNGGANLNTSPRVQSTSGGATVTPTSFGATVTPTSSGAIRVPTPKSISSPTPSVSPGGLIISPVTPHITKPSGASNVPAKQRVKLKQSNSGASQLPHLDLFHNPNYTSLTSLASLNFSPTITTSPSLIKSGLNMSMSMSTPKSMPNLKKVTQKSSGQVQKPAKPRAKQPPAHISTTPPPTSHSAVLNSGSTYAQTYLSTLANPYKTPPPLAGPGVEMTKHRTPPSQVATNNTKAFSNPRSIASNLHVPSTSSLSLSSSINNANTMVNSGLSSILSSSANTQSVNSSSSLTFQRISNSVTITPSSIPSYSGSGERSAVSSNNISSSNCQSAEIRPVKFNSKFDMNSLLQGSVILPTSTSSVITMANSTSNSKLGTGKLSNNIDRDLLSRKQ